MFTKNLPQSRPGSVQRLGKLELSSSLRTRSKWLLTLIILVLGLTQTTSNLLAYEAGDTVVVIKPTQLKINNKVIQKAAVATTYRVHLVNDHWLWVGEGVLGWINEKNVIALADAEKHFTNQLNQARSANNYLARAKVYQSLARYDQAVADYSTLLAMHKNLLPAYVGRAQCYLKTKSYQQAVNDCTVAIRSNPRSTGALNIRGNAYHHLGKYDLAISDYNLALQIKAKSAITYLNRGMAWDEKSVYNKAYTDYSKAIEQAPSLASAYAYRGLVSKRQGDLASTLSDYRKAIKLEDNNAHYHGMLAWLLATCSDTAYQDAALAVTHATKACELTSFKDAGYCDILAAAYASQGDFGSAEKYQAQAIKLLPNDTPKILKEELNGRLLQYKNRQPFIEKQPLGK